MGVFFELISIIFSALLWFSAFFLLPCPYHADALFTGAAEAVELCLELAGGICLWSGVMELMERCGVSGALSRFLAPALRRLFPRSAADPGILSAVAENISANLLGLGNAATPMGVRAATAMAAGCGGVASNELCRLVVLNTASVQLLPTTVAALRSAAGCATPLDILPAVWLSSLFSVTAGLAAAWLLEKWVK